MGIGTDIERRRSGPRLAACLVAALLGGAAGSAAAGSPSVSAPPNLVPFQPRATLSVALAGAAIPGSDGLGYFIPEVTRSLAESLRRGGLTMVSGAAPAESSTAISVMLEERAGDRVALSALVRGRRADIEGPVESMDVHSDELALRILALCLDGTAGGPSLHTSSRVGRLRESATTLKPGAPPTSPAPAPASTATGSPPSPPPSAAESPPAASTGAVPPTTVVPATSSAGPAASSPSSASGTFGAPPLMPPPGAPQGTPPSSATGPLRPASSEVVDPYAVEVRPTQPTSLVERPSAGFVPGRVVVHTILDPSGADAGTGSIATQALYALLQRKLHLSVVPLGFGLSALSVAADEGQRTQSRAVVMARLDGYALFATPGGPIARLRIELSVVREGRLALRRVLLAETPSGAIAAAAADGRRGRQLDPVYLAVSHALETQLADLELALSAAGGSP